MKSLYALSIAACLVSGAFFPSLSLAQTRYSCRASNGVQYQSDKPCPSTFVYYGPVAERQTTTTYVPKMNEAPEHLQYLSPKCSSMSEGIRTSAARGVRYEVVAELQRNYQRECADDERDARSQLSAARGETAAANRSAKQMVAMSEEQRKVRQQQCDESKRIVFFKKKRTDLTEGERQDLQRFEQNYKERCE